MVSMTVSHKQQMQEREEAHNKQRQELVRERAAVQSLMVSMAAGHQQQMQEREEAHNKQMQELQAAMQELAVAQQQAQAGTSVGSLPAIRLQHRQLQHVQAQSAPAMSRCRYGTQPLCFESSRCRRQCCNWRAAGAPGNAGIASSSTAGRREQQQVD
jgi:hypothetical protein